MPPHIKAADLRLVRTATTSGALVLANYLFWAVHAPILMQFLAVTLLLVALAFFLVRPPVRDYWPIKLLLICLAVMALGTPTTDWDARSIWLFHAKRIFADNSLYSQLDNYAEWSHNGYPVLVPALAASLAKMVGNWNEVFPKVSSVLALAPAILLLASVLKSRIEQLLLCCLLLLVCDGLLINGYMDAIVATYFTAASLLVIALTEPVDATAPGATGRGWLIALAAIVFATLSLVKNEGLAALVALVFSAALTRVAFRRTRSTLTIVAIFLVSIVPVLAWKVLGAIHGLGSDLGPASLIAQLSRRALSIGDHRDILSSLLLQAKFLVPLALFLFAVFGTAERAVAGFVSLSALSYGGILVAVYLTTPHDLRWLLATSAGRTILPIALILGYYFIVIPKRAFGAIE